METRIYMSIWEPPWRPVWCLFLVWCNIKSSLNDRCCWQSGSKRTNHAKKRYIYQCSCRFKETKLDEWLRGNEREWKNKRQGNQSKNGREEEHWELEEEGEKRTQGWNWISLRAGRGEQKQVISKHKFKSLCNEMGGDEDITLLLKVSAGGKERLFPTWLSWAGSLNQACMDGGDPLCLPHPSRSADPGAGKGKGCTTWKL